MSAQDIKAIKILELFAGIGAASKALANLGIEHEIVDAVEIDKYAIASFNAVHGTGFKPQDITTWDKDIECDLILHGSPCQDFSLAGKQAGGDEGSGTRSSLMYETLRIVAKLKPKYVIWENVKNLLSKKHVHNWYAYIKRMEQMGYTNYHKVLNAKDYGVPQNRERVFTISILRDEWFAFPEAIELDKCLKDILEDKVDNKFYLTDKQIKSLQASTFKQNKKFYKIDGLSPTLNTMGGGQRQPKVILEDGIRRLTPKECWRLMGFSDDDFAKAEKVNSNSQLYRQAGNSICVPVLEAIFKELFNA